MNEFENADPLKLLKLQAQEVWPEGKPVRRKAIVVYHANCMDGFTAAWAFHKLVEIGTPQEYLSGVVYVPMSYGDGHGEIQIPEYKDCDDLFILDFSFSKYELMFWAPFFRKVVLLDHHKTALENIGQEVWPRAEWPLNLIMVLDMNRSGAGITWDWFGNIGGQDEIPRSRLVDYIEDRDLWKFDLPHSKEISAYTQLQERNFVSWNLLDYNLKWEFSVVVAAGRLILQQREQLVKEIAAKPRKMEIFGVNGQRMAHAHCINCPPQFASEVGNYLVTHYGQIGVTYHQDQTGTTKFSLRSSSDLEDVAKIAEAFGGGGHRNAAGFVMKDPEEKEEIVLYAGREQPEEDYPDHHDAKEN